MVKKKGKKPNGSKREECEEAGELFLEVRKRYCKVYLKMLNACRRRSLQRRSLYVL